MGDILGSTKKNTNSSLEVIPNKNKKQADFVISDKTASVVPCRRLGTFIIIQWISTFKYKVNTGRAFMRLGVGRGPWRQNRGARAIVFHALFLKVFQCLCFTKVSCLIH